MLEKILALGRAVIPKKIFHALQPTYHHALAFLNALFFGFPSKKLHVVGVTGTKGKSTTVELINAILEEAGLRTAVLGTIRFKVGDIEEPNLYKMTLPGRSFVQRFLRRAVQAQCDWAVIEMTSEGARFSRHAYTDLDALVFTNLSPEHIESHGSYEKYRDAKLSIGHQLEKSTKKNHAIIANADDEEGSRFLGLRVPRSFPFSLEHAAPYEKTSNGFQWTFHNTLIRSHLPGEFNLYNCLAAATFAISQDISVDVIKRALEKFTSIRGRMEYVTTQQPFKVVVDYAHTPDSLRQFYGVFHEDTTICILGNTGGGRDTWKRPEMAHIAEEHCSHVILTNEDPYDEDPQKILDEMASGIHDTTKLDIILDRREAIQSAIHKASILAQGGNRNVHVLITGKGTDPYIMGPRGSKQPWDDATVVREELERISRE